MNSVSTLGMSYRTRMMVSQSQAEISKISGEVGSGFKRDVAASLGTRLGDAIKARNIFDQVSEYKNNITLLKMRMDTMANSLQIVEENAREFFGKLATLQGDSHLTDIMKQEAISTLGSIAQALNVMTGDRYLFSGVEISNNPVQPASARSAKTGISPMEAMAAMFASVPVTDVTSAQDLVDYIRLAFSDDPSIPADQRYEGTFYGGATQSDSLGNPTPRVTGRVDQNEVLDYGIQANDQAFRDLMQGIYMIAAVDLGGMPSDAKSVYIAEAYDALGRGLSALRQQTSVLAGYQNDLDAKTDVHDKALTILNERLVNLETVDLIESNARMTILETQLQASIVLTNKMSRLTIASMMV